MCLFFFCFVFEEFEFKLISKLRNINNNKRREEEKAEQMHVKNTQKQTEISIKINKNIRRYSPSGSVFLNTPNAYTCIYICLLNNSPQLYST